ncbi:MAG TPA: hypothetical protein VH170_04605 [Chthoniobacterales bacterium]|jgi:hypothetical protein|nr:hypothetical protein [Chthoniobacterales bacterium]
MLLLARPRGERLAAFISIGQVNFVAGLTLLTAFVVGGSGYLIRELHRQAGAAWVATGLPQSAAPAVAQPIVTDNMLHVSSIALGRTPIAVVNGALVSEGASVQLSTPDGNVFLRVGKIRDGAVDFHYAGKVLAVNLAAPALSKR